MLAASFIHVPASLGYGLLFVLVAAESAGVPLPGETALLAAAVLAAHGRLSITLVIVTAATGAILGDNVGYLIGRKGLRRILARPGRRERLLEQGRVFLARYGARAVFFGRWVSVVRIAIAWLAGAERMPWRRFLLWNALGGITWATSVGLFAYYVGSAASNIVTAFGYVAAAVAVIAAVGWIVRRRRSSAT
jgi:membrane-associated protein